MQGRQLARGSALSSCFAKKEEPGQGTDPAALRPRLAMCSASTASTKAPSPNPGTVLHRMARLPCLLGSLLSLQTLYATSPAHRTNQSRCVFWARM